MITLYIVDTIVFSFNFIGYMDDFAEIYLLNFLKYMDDFINWMNTTCVSLMVQFAGLNDFGLDTYMDVEIVLIMPAFSENQRQ